MNELEEIRRKKMKEMEGKIFGRKEALEKPIQVTDETFDRVIKTNRVVVIDFWASWCPPCRIIAPVIEALAKDYAGKVIFGKLNCDENRIVPEKFGIMAIPTLLIFKNGELVDEVAGAVPRQQIEQKIKKVIE